jgi:hypothetical protein
MRLSVKKSSPLGLVTEHSHSLRTLLREQQATITAENENNIRELLVRKREESRTSLGLRTSQMQQLREEASLVDPLEFHDDRDDEEDPENFIFSVQNIAEQHKLLESYSQFHHDSSQDPMGDHYSAAGSNLQLTDDDTQGLDDMSDFELEVQKRLYESYSQLHKNSPQEEEQELLQGRIAPEVASSDSNEENVDEFDMDEPRRFLESFSQMEESADEDYLNSTSLTLELDHDEEEMRQREDAGPASQDSDADDNMIQVGPDLCLPLKSSAETWKAIVEGRITVIHCWNCSNELGCADDVDLVLCADCWTFSPVDQNNLATTASFEPARSLQRRSLRSVGIGVKPEDILASLESQEQRDPE